MGGGTNMCDCVYGCVLMYVCISCVCVVIKDWRRVYRGCDIVVRNKES